MLHLEIIVCSTRQGRKGIAVANWVHELAKEHDEFEVEFVDLREVNLPLFDEPRHPSQQQYEHEHTRRWSEIVSRADGFVFVMPEYNHGFPASIKNALDFVYKEWNHKPVGFVTYGGVAGGTRSLQLLKPVLIAIQITPVLEAVNIPFFAKKIDAQGVFHPEEVLVEAAHKMLKSTARWALHLKAFREGK